MEELELGPQYDRDGPFAARMRCHQSWYRARRLGVPCGTGPQRRHTSPYGNMLRPEDAERGLNFLTPDILQVAQQRLAEGTGTVEPYRLLHNMLSSQPMCFNLFGPLVNDHELARRMLQELVPDDVAEVTQVALEFAPRPASEYLNDRTAFDAFIAYRRADGERSFVGIETKLTEPFSQRKHDTPEYRRWSDRSDSPWLATARLELAEMRHNQLWRDHLLAVAMNLHPASPYAGGYLMLVRHPGDSECAQVVKGYQKLLKPDDRSFIDCPLGELMNVAEAAVRGEHQQHWLAAFNARYLDLALSEAEWQRRSAARR